MIFFFKVSFSRSCPLPQILRVGRDDDMIWLGGARTQGSVRSPCTRQAAHSILIDENKMYRCTYILNTPNSGVVLYFMLVTSKFSNDN